MLRACLLALVVVAAGCRSTPPDQDPPLDPARALRVAQIASEELADTYHATRPDLAAKFADVGLWAGASADLLSGLVSNGTREGLLEALGTVLEIAADIAPQVEADDDALAVLASLRVAVRLATEGLDQ